LLAARRTWPALLDRSRTKASILPIDADGADASEKQALLVVERGGEQGLLVVANLTDCRVPLCSEAAGSVESEEADQRGDSESRPTVARLSELFSSGAASRTAVAAFANHACLLSTEAAAYGGVRDTTEPVDELLPYELVIWSMEEVNAS
ncbi:MAG: hypothetical protein ACOCWL_01105, partial [Thermoguttaceae bacterium]